MYGLVRAWGGLAEPVHGLGHSHPEAHPPLHQYTAGLLRQGVRGTQPQHAGLRRFSSYKGSTCCSSRGGMGKSTYFVAGTIRVQYATVVGASLWRGRRWAQWLAQSHIMSTRFLSVVVCSCCLSQDVYYEREQDYRPGEFGIWCSGLRLTPHMFIFSNCPLAVLCAGRRMCTMSVSRTTGWASPATALQPAQAAGRSHRQDPGMQRWRRDR
jgi:hypothetical protein